MKNLSMLNHFNRYLAALCGKFVVVSFLLAIALPSYAAVIEEIIVTAQKREQNAQEVGIAISALTGDQMTQLGYSNAQQVTALAPGVHTVQPNGEANYSLAIRGVASSDFTTNVESPVAIYMDEVYISQMSGAGFMLFDMERVEILKGPQGTLYGRNATGGLAHYLSRKPSEELNGYARLTAGRYDQIKFEGAVGGSLSDTLMARLSIATNDHDPYVENRIGTDLNNGNEQGARLQLLWAPNDEFDLLLNVRGMNQDIDTGFFENVSSVIEGRLTPNVVNPVLGYIDNDGDVYAGDYDSPGFNDLETRGYSATINWDFETFTFTSITDFSTVKRDYIEDSDASPVPLFNFFLNTDAEQFSQEFRFAGDTDNMHWVAGFYYLDLAINDANGAETEPFIDPDNDTPAISGLDNPYEMNTESYSVFGQVEYDLSETWTLIAGLRWIRDEKDMDYQINAVDFIPGTKFRNGNPNILANIATYRGSREDNEIAGRLGLNWNLSDDAMIYMSYNRGVKSGGYNAPVFPLNPPLGYTDDVMSFDPEQLDAFEVGFKSRWHDGLMQVNGAFYYYDYQDYQAFQIIGIDTITTNADADSIGGELEILTNPIAGLDIIFGAAYNDIDVDLGDGSPETTSVQSPRWNLNALVRYEFEVGAGTVALQYDAVYRSELFFSLTGAETVTENGYTVSNASVMYTAEDERWSVMGFVHNLTGEEYLVQTFDLSGPNVFGMTEQYYGRPRWAGVTFSLNFN
ncbi:MAG: TonB-dependent receptor [Gammaproteobacteria bacterium]|nr:TonB-dependent receptor [Gammaproteobacteria bacterium]